MKKMILFVMLAVIIAAGSANADVVASYQLGEDDGAGAVASGVGIDPTVDSAGGLNLSPSGDPTYSDQVPTGIGSSLSMEFDGDDYYNASQVPSTATDDISLSAYVRPTTLDGFNFVASIGSGGNQGLGLLQVGGNWGIIHMGVQGNFDGPAVVLDEWVKLELRRTNGISELYIDDIATGTTLDSVPFAPSDSFTIGANQLNATAFEGYFQGQIDQVEVTVIPEPTTMMLLAAGGLAVMRKRKAA